MLLQLTAEIKLNVTVSINAAFVVVQLVDCSLKYIVDKTISKLSKLKELQWPYYNLPLNLGLVKGTFS